LCGYESVAHV